MENSENKIKELVDKLMMYRNAYYDGDPVIEDEQFDYEEQKLKDIDPNNEYFVKIGKTMNSVNNDDKIIHKIPMLSMQKVKTAEDANKWFFDLVNNLDVQDPKNIRLLYEPKIDGISGSISYDSNGNIEFATTRGDGFVGQRIHNAHLISSIPKKLLPNYTIRGEFYVPKRYADYFGNRPLRNICTGLLKKKSDTNDIEKVEYIIYDIYDENGNFVFDSRMDKIEKIRSILNRVGEGSNTILVPINSDINIKKVYDLYLNKLRNEWDFETDGLVLTIDGGPDVYDAINRKYTISTHNKYNMALKPPAKFSKTKIVGFSVEVSKIGKLAPVAILEPVYIDSVRIERASLYNFEYIQKNHIGIGSTVLLFRSNDVIPKIEEVYNIPEDDIKEFILRKCPSCGSKLERNGKDLVCNNYNNCKGIYKGRILNLLNVCGVKNLGPAIVSEIIQMFEMKGIPFYMDSFLKFSLSNTMKQDILGDLYNYNSLKYNNICKELDNLSSNMTELNLIVGFAIPLVGERILLKNNINSCQDLMKYFDSLHKSNIASTAFDTVLLNYFNNKFNRADFENSVKTMKKNFKPMGKPKGLKICISGNILGKNKSDIIREIEKSGNTYVNSVTIDTDILISDGDVTSKYIKAKKYNVNIMRYSDFNKKYNK